MSKTLFVDFVIDGMSKEDWTEGVALLYASLGHGDIIVKE